MPWSPSQAIEHTKKADTPKLQKLWATVANRVLEKTGDEAKAIKEANAIVAHRKYSRFI